MKLDYGPAPLRRPLIRDAGVLVLQLLCAYFILSITTLPLMDKWWIGELPMFALPQVPKAAIAQPIRKSIVMPLFRVAGWSSGSFSPDYVRARPYALAIAYAVVLGVYLLGARLLGPATALRRRWMLITLATALVDFAFTLWLAGGPGLSVY